MIDYEATASVAPDMPTASEDVTQTNFAGHNPC